MIYEYYCEACDIKFEVITHKNNKEIPCKYCKDPAQKVISAGSFVIKGYNEKNGYAKK